MSDKEPDVRQSSDSVGITDAAVETNQMNGLREEKDEKVLVYEPKRQFEPMLCIERLFKSHLRPKSSYDKPVPTAAQETSAAAVEFSADTQSQKTIGAVNTLETDNSEAGIRVDHIKDGISEWMSRPKDKKSQVKPGLECVERLRKYYIFDEIRIIDRLFEDSKFSRNCLTVRNADYQQLFYVGPKNNKNTSKYRAFTLRVVDQYCRHVLSIRKRAKCCCCAGYKADIECPPGAPLGKLRQRFFWFRRTVEFHIYEPLTRKKRFIIKRSSEAMVGYEFEVFNTFREVIGSITKRFDKIYLNNVYKEDHCIRVAVPQVFTTEDKALIISSAIIINIFYLRQFTLR